MIQEEKIFFRNQFRNARYKTLVDAEDFDSLFHAIETFGAFLTDNPKHNSIGRYKSKIEDFIITSPFYNDLPKKFPSYHNSFSLLYEEVRKFRNESAHQGVHARNKIRFAIELCLIIETVLNVMDDQISNYMIRSPLTVSDWEPLSHIRKEMLINSYSYLPIYIDNKWKLVSDYGLFNYLNSKDDALYTLRESIKKARDNGLKLESPDYLVNEDFSIKKISLNSTLPVLVYSKEHPDRLVGILTSFDLI